jgi:hypothetical protein
LLNDPDCATLFGTGHNPLTGETVSPQTVLFDLLNGIIYGSLTVGEPPSKPGTQVSAVTKQGQLVIGDSGIRIEQAYVEINDLVGSFVSGDLGSQAATILHELGHVMNDLFGAGTSIIKTDGDGLPNGVQISMDNTALIDKVCFHNVPSPGMLLLP